ncbi:hypothetical protein [Rodentibacter haemolyticus]|uniref:Uncharacterized protein n=1 Tax=Rodentibacter haemolyticus TaxID=2778911 RepID=A0ABX6UXD1_9PAST|nr:hypothetical protein [Rodentibacter haemolyticus]QPB42762.1 hypothetical protein IHV77_01135 [Rodentibacter haemolyticus]
MKKTADEKEKVKKLQEEIKELIKHMDITQKEAVDIINEEYGEKEELKLDNFKKDLQRSTNSYRLEPYFFALKNSAKYNKMMKIGIGDIALLGKEQYQKLEKLSEQIKEYINSTNSR